MTDNKRNFPKQSIVRQQLSASCPVSFPPFTVGCHKLYQIIPVSATPAQNFEVLSGFIHYTGKTCKSNGFYCNVNKKRQLH